MSAVRLEELASDKPAVIAGNSQIASITGPLRRFTRLFHDDFVLGKCSEMVELEDDGKQATFYI